jgi:hypothetical protein
MLPHSTTVNKAKQEKPTGCCVQEAPGDDPVEEPNACGQSVGADCGPFKGYGEATSLCCVAGDKSGVVVCDAGGVSLTYLLCPDSYSCVQHYGVGWKRDDGEDEDEDLYALCERS